MAKLPSFQFYPGDWLKDASLRVCSIFARGLLVDLLCVCFESKHRGQFVRPDGVTPWTDEQIVDCVCGSDRQTKLAGLAELIEHGVLKRCDKGITYSARMIRDEDIRQMRTEHGGKGGSKAQANDRAKREQTIEQKHKQTREQKSTPSSSSSSSSSEGKDTPLPPEGEAASAVATEEASDSVTAAQFIMTSWNAVGPIRSSRLNDKLKAAVKSRLRTPWWSEHWLAALEKVPDCGFLNGDGPRGWKADFAWFLKPNSVQEILDGKYDTTTSTAAAPKSASTTRFENTISALEQWVADGTARHESLRQNDCPSIGGEVDH